MLCEWESNRRINQWPYLLISTQTSWGKASVSPDRRFKPDKLARTSCYETRRIWNTSPSGFLGLRESCLLSHSFFGLNECQCPSFPSVPWLPLPPSIHTLSFTTSLPFSFLSLTAKHCLKPHWVKTEVFLLHQGQWQSWRKTHRPIRAQPGGGDTRWGKRNRTKGEREIEREMEREGERKREGGLSWLQINISKSIRMS